MNAADTIYAFLKARLSDGFWRESAFNAIRASLATNHSFVDTVYSQHVFRHKGQPYVKCYRAKVSVINPDAKTIEVMMLEYTFDPKRKMAHRVTRKPIKEKAA